MQLKIAGALVNLEAGTLNLKDVIGQRSIGSAAVLDDSGSQHYSDGTAWQVLDASSVLIASGALHEDREEKPDFTARLRHTVQLADNVYWLDKRIAARGYTSMLAGDIASDLMTQYGVPEGLIGRHIYGIYTTQAALAAFTMSNVQATATGGGDLELINATLDGTAQIALDVSNAGAIAAAISGFTWSQTAPTGSSVSADYSTDGGATWHAIGASGLGNFPLTDIPAAQIISLRFTLHHGTGATPTVSNVKITAKTSQIGDGPTVIAATFNYVKVSDCLKALASKAGFWWNVDKNRRLYFNVLGTLTAPFSIDGTTMIDGTVKRTNANPLYRNRQFIRGIQGVTSAQTETRKGDGTTRAFTFSYPLAAQPTACTVNGVAKTVGIKGVDDVSHTKDFYWSKGDAVLAQDTTPAILISTDTLSLTYQGQYTAIVQVDDGAGQAARAALEAVGSGIVEDVQDAPAATSTDEAYQTANGLLQQFSRLSAFALEFTIREPGLIAGQLLTVNLPEHGINSVQMLIESVDLRDQSSEMAPRYAVKALAGPTDTTWVDFFSSLIAQRTAYVDRITLGASTALTIAITFSETWAWTETVTETAYACPICNLASMTVPFTVC